LISDSDEIRRVKIYKTTVKQDHFNAVKILKSTGIEFYIQKHKEIMQLYPYNGQLVYEIFTDEKYSVEAEKILKQIQTIDTIKHLKKDIRSYAAMLVLSTLVILVMIIMLLL
jgi:hypothetical protein